MLVNNNWTRFIFGLLSLFHFIDCGNVKVNGITWQDEDSIIVEAPLVEKEESEGARWKRQFPGFHPQGFQGFQNFQHFQQFPGIAGAGGSLPGGLQGFPGFPPGWPHNIFGPGSNLIGQRPTLIPGIEVQPPVGGGGGGGGGGGVGQCLTKTGEKGRCVTLRQCYPVLYDSADPNDETRVKNPALAEMYQAATAACSVPVMGNYLYFSADALTRQSMVCCPTKKPTSRPPWVPPSIKLTTQKPPAFPSWTFRTTSVSPFVTTTSTTTTTPRPSHVIGGVGGPRPPVTPAPRPTAAPVAPISSSCGVSRIVGGTVPRPGSYPWIVSLVNGRRHFCGGSLIDSQTILTAAHCVHHMTSNDVAQLVVLLGDHDLATTTEAQHTVRKVKTLVRHRGFNFGTLHNDIALLKLDKPVQFTDNIQPICLTDGSKRFDTGNEQATVAGWGSMTFNAQPVATLRHVTLRVWTRQECAQKYGSLAKGGILQNQICAGSQGRDSCRGDSGGPLMSNRGGVYEQIGLVSWGIECGTYPGVYTSIGHFRDWIEKNRFR